MQGPTMADARSWLERWQWIIAAVVALGVGVDQRFARAEILAQVDAKVESIQNSQAQRFGQVNDRLDQLEGFQARADRVGFAELVLGCANRRIATEECNARLPAEIRDVMPKGR